MFFSLQFLTLITALFLIPILVLRYRRLQSIPGPLVASFTDLWQAYYQNVDNFTNTLAKLHNQYGAFVRLGPNRVSLGDAAAVSSIYTMHGEFRKAESYHPLRALANGTIQGSMIDMDDEKMVSALKRAVGAAFSAKNILDYEEEVEETAAVLIAKTMELGSIDLFQTLQQFQVDFLMKIAFSETTKHLEESKDTLGLTFHARFAHWASWQAVPRLERLIFKPPFLSYFLQSAPTPTWARLARQKFQSRQATKQSTPKGHKGDLLGQYLDAAEKHKDTISPALIQRMVSSTISAGFDTTAFTMTTILYYLLRNPSTLAKLQKDIGDAISTGRLSDPPKFHEADKLEYLSATMKEAMRCYPFLNLPLERIVPDGGATIAGQWFPGGTVVGCHPSIVHRDTTVFGSDADRFRPERWLVRDEGRRVRMERASLGFGNGKRICLGRHLAELEIKKVIPALLMRFQITLVDPETRLEPMDNWTSFPKPIVARFEERNWWRKFNMERNT